MPPEIMSQSCGCTIAYAVDTNGERDNRIVYCPTHAAAPAMAALLRRFVQVDRSSNLHSGFGDEARALLKKIDGCSKVEVRP